MEEKEISKEITAENAESKTEQAVESESEVAKLTKERDDYLAGWQRAKADFINYRKEELRRLQDVARAGSEEIIKDLIPVIDSFDLGLAALEKAGHVEKGVYMIKGQLEDMLKRNGVERMKVELGGQFNPTYQEAIGVIDASELPPDRKWEPGTIAEEIEAGYSYQGKLLRPTRVRLVK
ncbi:MAG: nucleotide exchange factor GrpE [Patescibacteria group bacterium]|nr:nucleotide exchange factor GrpE [Patescibacteria group bacterium]MCL5224449.1 nucleotide exchange factor GrpE [Patescibacteria group bacterium]